MFKYNIEYTCRTGPNLRLWLVRGWVVAPADIEFAEIAWETDHQTVIGNYGLPRTDVARTFPAEPQAGFSGFALFAPDRLASKTSRLIARDIHGQRHDITTLPLPEEFGPADLSLSTAELAQLSPAQPPTARTDPTRPVLFIGHDFACAGAQLILLRQLRWLKTNTALAFELLLAVPRSATQHAGPNEQKLLNDLHALCPVHFLSDATGAAENALQIHAGDYRLIYANTATLGWLLPSLQPITCPVVSHIHELGFWIERRTGLEIFARQRRLTTRFIACSEAVATYLRSSAEVPPEQIAVIHECGSMARANDIRHSCDRSIVRAQLGLDNRTFAIMACGTFDWRKGAELFLPICVALRRLLGGSRAFRAYWIGSYGTDMIRDQFDHEAKVAGLEGVVQLLGHHPEPLQLMMAADCFALPSREDPFPLVMLEAATLGLPVVGFRASGGVVEFVDEDAGLLADYLDIEGFATALCRLALNPTEARHRGEAAQHRASTEFDEETSFRRIHALIETLATSSSSN